MRERLESLRVDALRRIGEAVEAEELRAVEKDFLGKEGAVAEILGLIPTLAPEERREAGQGANQLKTELLAAISAAKASLEEAEVAAQREAGGFDPTLQPAATPRGGLHLGQNGQHNPARPPRQPRVRAAPWGTAGEGSACVLP